MQKRKLENMVPPELSADGDHLYAIEAQIANIDGTEVLEVDLWGEKRSNGSREKICRHFVYGTRYVTLFESEQSLEYKQYCKGQWSDMSLCTLMNKGIIGYSNYYDTNVECSFASSEVIHHFAKRENMNPMKALKYHESELYWQKQESARNRKQERINHRMEAVAPIIQDVDFNAWLDEVVFPERYIFVEMEKRKQGYRCYCATCGRMHYEKKREKHNHRSRCPKCGTDAIIKTRVRQVENKKNVLVAQPLDEYMWVLRHFNIQEKCGIQKEKGKQYGSRNLCTNEKIRMFIGGGELDGITTAIYWGQHYMAADKEQEWWDKKGFPQKVDRDFFLYPGRMDRSCMGRGLKRILAAGAQAGVEMPYNIIIRWHGVKDYAYIEYLIKGKLDRLAAEVVKEYEYKNAIDLLEIGADTLSGLLRLDGQQVGRLKQINGGRYALRFLQEEKASGRVSQENLLYAERHKILPKKMQTERTGLSLNKALNYIRRQSACNKMSPKKILEYYRDYLNMAEEFGADLTDSIICTNKRMLEYHDAYLEEKNRAADEKRAGKLAKKYPGIRKGYTANSALFGWKNEEYEIIVPRRVEDIMEEGRKLHHCVAASEHYFREMDAGNSYILFLRRKENRNKPYYTIQAAVTDGKMKILQWYAAYDRKPDKEIVRRVLARWKKEVNKRLNMSMLIPA